MITYEAFMALVDSLQRLHNWRRGQCYFNAANMIGASPPTGGLDDPFYNDENIPDFFAWLVEQGIVLV